MIRVLIADDHQMFIDGLKSLLVEEKAMCVVGEARNGYEVLDICDQEEVDIVIMDINMPLMDGIQTSKRLSKTHPSVKILGLSMYNDKDYITDILKAGARGYVLKNTGKDNLLDAIATLQSGADKLFISKNTVETHRKNLLYKLKAKNTAELVNNAYKQRLIQ
jgi:DNA-binding NarL/FixJ family response regulator